MNLTIQQTATVLAALRLYEATLANMDEVGHEIRDIATNGNTCEPLPWQQIDNLCDAVLALTEPR